MSKSNFQQTSVDSSKPATQRAGDSIERVGNRMTKESPSKSGNLGQSSDQKIQSPGSDKRRY